jgi:hypothetical protein
LYGIYTTQFTENDGVNYTNHELFYPYPHFEPIMLIFVLVFGGVGVICLSFIDRKRSLTIDGTSNQVKFEYVKWPRYDTINYELRSPISCEIVKKTWGKSYHEKLLPPYRKCDLEIDNQRWLATEQKKIQYGGVRHKIRYWQNENFFCDTSRHRQEMDLD